MGSREKVKIAVAIVCFAAISVLFVAEHQRRRRRRNQKQSSLSTCYLHTESKPQSAFKRVLADNSYTPFKHLKLQDSKNEHVSSMHPYEPELRALLENPRLPMSFRDGEMDLGLTDSYIWVDSETQLHELADALSREKVFAVDTEQHGLRSFLGFTALIQISTQSSDYLVDAIALHDVMGVLRPVFADPSICKVFHGADNDVLWLQRDFHIYVINLFDTAKACEVLSKAQKSLAYLLDTYCSISTNKLLQREDWRQRPLSEDMVTYARTDAHYLLYIADCLIAELKEQGGACSDEKYHFVLEANRRSTMTCLQLYTKDIDSFPGESATSSIFSRHLNGQEGVSAKYCDIQFQERVRRLCAWRDLMARVHDESLRYVLSDQAIVALADEIPASPTEVCNTISLADQKEIPHTIGSLLPTPSPVVLSHLEDFYDVFQENMADLNAFLLMILQKHMGSNGDCPVSIYNYSLLSKSTLKLTKKSDFKNVAKNAKRNTRKSRQLFVQKFSCKSPVYHNCRIYASDGRLLCYCDRRKLEWYLRRDLAKLVDEDPPAIMLLFEPKGRPEDEGNDFYIQSKQNVCVGCGEGNHYLRYRVIPSCYRIHFPEHLKSHRSHDIVLLCVDCHEIAHSAAEKYKRQIAVEFDIPLFVQKVINKEQAQVISGPSTTILSHDDGVSPLVLRSSAMALLRHGSSMPSKRHEELTQIVMQYYGGREVTADDLENALLVGMSPHERRRLEKKKGLSLKYSTDKDEKNNCSMSASTRVTADSLELDTLDQCHSIEALKKQLNDPCPVVADIDTENYTLCSISESEREVSTSYHQGTNSSGNEASTNDESDKLGTLPNGTGKACGSQTDGISKHNSKLSLLGHGPHGKLVVDHLLKEYGEDGVRLFCQRWRQVFVEAIHPRFLPAGWDIMHSGRRDFGEFSVYNPAHRSNAAASKV